MYAIEISSITKRYGNKTALDNVNLTIENGELISLLGLNGAGKTTLIKILSGLTSPDEGTATIKGFDISQNRQELKKILSVSPQETAVASNLTVYENMKFLCGLYGFSKTESEEKISHLMRTLSLESVSSNKAGKLSGGYQRRLSIALALIPDPEILFLDEPTLGLDVIARSELWDIIRSLKGKTTIILTTHYMEEAEELSDRTCVMKDGKILYVGTSAEIKEKTSTDSFEKAFIEIVRGQNE